MTALGLTVWRLPPDAFWRLTPREIAAALAGLTRRKMRAPSRLDLSNLLNLYPDES